jgi:hypothetical protein
MSEPEDFAEAAGSGTTINLSLISHTNAGKTTLARTLLGRDVGEVRDAAHVTDVASGYVLVQAGEDTLMLWDTPGFGDTARLLTRLRLAGNPLGWLLTQVWDRWRERPLWSSQQAVRNAQRRADVILYLVNASEDPAAAAYVALEMEVLAWIGKPVILLLNQMGPPRPDADADVERWRAHLGSGIDLAAVLPMDAFARCWVQEGVLLGAVRPLLAQDRHAAMDALSARWEAINRERFAASMAALARALAEAATDREAVGDGDWRGKLSDMLTGGKAERPEMRAAMAALAERLANGVRASTDALIALHGLSGKATRAVLERLRDDYAQGEKAPEGTAALFGGVMSGIAGGLLADIAAGGLTLGGGMIIGGILGALGAGGLAHTINLARGDDGSSVRWSAEFLAGLVGAALLRYLAVAHFGRGRGDWEEGEHPAFWKERVETVIAGHRATIDAIHADARHDDIDAIAARLARLLEECGTEVLALLYPQAMARLRIGAGDALPPPVSSPQTSSA